jgi:hypothetical protein
MTEGYIEVFIILVLIFLTVFFWPGLASLSSFAALHIYSGITVKGM